MSHLFIGIDPGAHGAVSVFRTGCEGVADIPSFQITKGKKARTVVDFKRFVDLLQVFTSGEDKVTAIIEDVGPMPTDGAIAAWYFGHACATIEAALKSFSNIEIRRILPATWKKHFGLWKKDKDDSRRLALDRIPSLASSLGRKKDHNRAEAVLIGLYGYETISKPPV